MSKKSNTESVVLWCNVALAVFTAVMVVLTWLSIKESREASYRQIGVQNWLEMEKRFDSSEMRRARQVLAQQFLSTTQDHNKISESVMDFFEDVGTLYKRGMIDHDLTQSSFSFHACRWWEASKTYVDAEQKRHGEDGTLFVDFRDLAATMRMRGEKIDDAELKRFLEDEARLVP